MTSSSGQAIRDHLAYLARTVAADNADAIAIIQARQAGSISSSLDRDAVRRRRKDIEEDTAASKYVRDSALAQFQIKDIDKELVQSRNDAVRAARYKQLPLAPPPNIVPTIKSLFNVVQSLVSSRQLPTEYDWIANYPWLQHHLAEHSKFIPTHPADKEDAQLAIGVYDPDGLSAEAVFRVCVANYRQYQEDYRDWSHEKTEIAREIKSTAANNERSQTALVERNNRIEQELADSKQSVEDSARELAMLRQTHEKNVQDMVNLRQSAIDSAHELAALYQADGETAREMATLRQTGRETAREMATLRQTGRETGHELATLRQTAAADAVQARQECAQLQQTVDLLANDAVKLNDTIAIRDDRVREHESSLQGLRNLARRWMRLYREFEEGWQECMREKNTLTHDYQIMSQSHQDSVSVALFQKREIDLQRRLLARQNVNAQLLVRALSFGLADISINADHVVDYTGICAVLERDEAPTIASPRPDENSGPSQWQVCYIKKSNAVSAMFVWLLAAEERADVNVATFLESLTLVGNDNGTYTILLDAVRQHIKRLSSLTLDEKLAWTSQLGIVRLVEAVFRLSFSVAIHDLEIKQLLKDFRALLEPTSELVLAHLSLFDGWVDTTLKEATIFDYMDDGTFVCIKDDMMIKMDGVFFLVMSKSLRKIFWFHRTDAALSYSSAWEWTIDVPVLESVFMAAATEDFADLCEPHMGVIYTRDPDEVHRLHHQAMEGWIHRLRADLEDMTTDDADLGIFYSE